MASVYSKRTPPHTPGISQTPGVSRNNSTTSINSLRSEPAWQSSRHQSDASLASPKARKGSTASISSTTAHKKGFMGGLFHRDTKEEKAEKAKHTEVIILGSKHAAAVKTKMTLDPAYREFQEKHKKASVAVVDPAYLEFLKKHAKPNVKTAGITLSTVTAHGSAAEQEARFPHSGPPVLHGSVDHTNAMLLSIESDDEADSDEDEAERTRREWNAAPEHNIGDSPQNRSREASAWSSPMASPIHSRDTSPHRSARPSIAMSVASKRSTYAGYTRDATGRWTKRTSPGEPTHVHHPSVHGVSADLLAASLAERLDKAA